MSRLRIIRADCSYHTSRAEACSDGTPQRVWPKISAKMKHLSRANFRVRTVLVVLRAHARWLYQTRLHLERSCRHPAPHSARIIRADLLRWENCSYHTSRSARIIRAERGLAQMVHPNGFDRIFLQKRSTCHVSIFVSGPFSWCSGRTRCGFTKLDCIWSVLVSTRPTLLR